MSNEEKMGLTEHDKCQSLYMYKYMSKTTRLIIIFVTRLSVLVLCFTPAYIYQIQIIIYVHHSTA